jgi:hypothetical protein
MISMKDASWMPGFIEPWSLNFDATVEFLPAATPENFKHSGVDSIAQKWK